MLDVAARTRNSGLTQQAKLQMYKLQLDHLLANTPAESLATAGACIVSDTQEEAGYMRLLLDAHGLGHVAVRVKARRQPATKSNIKAAVRRAINQSHHKSSR